jgi:hypothetical protein
MEDMTCITVYKQYSKQNFTTVVQAIAARGFIKRSVGIQDLEEMMDDLTSKCDHETKKCILYKL